MAGAPEGSDQVTPTSRRDDVNVVEVGDRRALESLPAADRGARFLTFLATCSYIEACGPSPSGS
jgi:hypothetical protein